MKIALRWGGCPLPRCFCTVSAVNAQTYLNCNTWIVKKMSEILQNDCQSLDGVLKFLKELFLDGRSLLQEETR